MKSIAIHFLLLPFLCSAQYGAKEARLSYESAVENSEICKTQISKLKQSSDPVEIGYLGAYQAIQAKHVVNPLKKLSTFKTGKSNIEKAIVLDPNNLELRLLRLSIQKNTPGILDYKASITLDEQMLYDNWANINDITLKKRAKNLLLSSKNLSIEQKNKLQ